MALCRRQTSGCKARISRSRAGVQKAGGRLVAATVFITFQTWEPVMKLTSRISLLVTLVAIALVASSASAQQKGRGGRGGFGGLGGPANALTIAGNEAVQKELGLSADVVGKVTALRDDYRAAIQKEYQTAGIDFQNLTAESRQKMVEVGNKLNGEFDPKVKSLISGDSYKRLQQIQLQYNLRNSGPAAVLAA